ncbi:MAG: hypothetical protein AAF212_05915 [Verrucomicrobiota bacterium]
MSLSKSNQQDQYSVYIGPSTGWLSAKICSDFRIHHKITESSSATAVEVVWSPGFRKRAFEQESIHEGVPYKSLHLSSFRGFQEPLTGEQNRQLEDIRAIIDKFGFHNTTVHPDTISPFLYKVFENSGIPISIENMDREKVFGQRADDLLIVMKNHHLGGVIDLQHAYELSCDTGESYTEIVKDLTNALERGRGISHVHVSGETSVAGQQIEGHAQLMVSSNAEVILGGIETVFEITGKRHPIILEGDPLPEEPLRSSQSEFLSERIDRLAKIAIENISEEISFVRRYCRFL